MEQTPQAQPAPTPRLTDEVPADATLNIPDGSPAPTKFSFEIGDQKPEGFEDPPPSQPPQEAGATQIPANIVIDPKVPHVSEVHKRELVREQARADELRAKLLGTVAKRNLPPVEPKAQPVPAAIAEQTRLEMEAGRKMNDHHAGVRSIPPRRIDPREGTSVPVFRPADYVPPLTKSPGARNDAEQSRNV